MLSGGSASAAPPTSDYGVIMNRIVTLSLICAAACQTQPATTSAPQSGSSDLFANQGGEGTTLATIGDQRLTVEAMEKKINAMCGCAVSTADHGKALVDGLAQPLHLTLNP